MKLYYEQAGIKIYHGDSRDILPQLASVDVVLTDPPYGVEMGDKPNGQKIKRQKYISLDDKAELIVPLVNEVLGVCLKMSKRVVMTPGVRNMFAYPRPSHCGSFYYPAAVGCNPWGFSCWQPIFYYGKDPYGGKGSRPDSFLSYEASEKNGHPCPKPIGQWKKLLVRVSLPGDIVLDPFMGSGTTLRAAKDLGNTAIGIDIEERYCEIAARRLAQEVFSFEPESVSSIHNP